MNLAIRGIDANIAWGDSFHNDQHADIVDCMVALPSQLFYNTMIPACLFASNARRCNYSLRGMLPNLRNGRREVLFIDVRNMGKLIDRRYTSFRCGHLVIVYTSKSYISISIKYRTNWTLQPFDCEKLGKLHIFLH